jgi:NAD(P)-dependent dehydrogenase (short-subunit alcohol dehydrogenase family)
MQNLNGKRVVITGGSQGLGLAMVEALVACGANAMSRDRANLAADEQSGAAVMAGDATDATLMNEVVREGMPEGLILSAGARLPMKPIDQPELGRVLEHLEHRREGRPRGYSVRAQHADEARRPRSDHVERRLDGACRAMHRASRLEALRRIYRRQTDAVVHGPKRKLGIQRARPHAPLPGARAMSTDSRHHARSSGCGRLCGNRGCQHRRACHAMVWLDPASGARWRTGCRTTRRSVLYAGCRLRLWQQWRHPAARRMIRIGPPS